MDGLSRAFGRLLDGLMLVACLLLLAMTLLIGADVVGRNAGLGGIAWSGEISEDKLDKVEAFIACAQALRFSCLPCAQ